MTPTDKPTANAVMDMLADQVNGFIPINEAYARERWGLTERPIANWHKGRPNQVEVAMKRLNWQTFALDVDEATDLMVQLGAAIAKVRAHERLRR